MDRALDRFPHKNRTFEFRLQARARSETNNYKRLWIALLIGFWKQINVLIWTSSFENVFRCKSYSNIFNRARSETNNYKSLWIALLIGFQIRIELLNLESKPERDLNTDNYKSLWIVHASTGFQLKNRTFEFRNQALARSEANNYKSLWIALLIGFQNKNRTFEFRIQTTARSETNSYKSLWIALLIGFQIRIELLNLESKPERDLKQTIIKVFGSRSWSVSK